ncbi:unnamed protein product [Ectocarpus sp. 12 AP-2014]
MRFMDEALDFRLLTRRDSDNNITKGAKFLLRHVFGSVRVTIIHSRVLRRYLCLDTGPVSDITVVQQQGDGDTLATLRQMVNDTDGSVLDVIETTNGAMITHIDVGKVRERLHFVTSRWLEKRGRFIRNDPESGLYKKLFRLKFVYDHLQEVYSDKYNIYQAAYVDSAYNVRAMLCFVMQMISFVALMKEGEGGASLDANNDGARRSVVDVILIVVTILYMFFNLPANSITSSMSHNVVLFHMWIKMKMYVRVVFVVMDLIVNSVIISLMPLVSARLLYKTADTASIVTTSLSVFFVTSLDDSAITKSESNNMLSSQGTLLREITERVDSFVDSNHMRVVAYLPWLEIVFLTASVVASYAILL